MFETMHDAASHLPAMLAASTLHTWLLWGGLSLLFLVAYIGIYVWMRRPDFGEGKRHDRVASSTTTTATAQSTASEPVETAPDRPAARSDSPA